MTAVQAPARRRRHACLIATAVQLVGECAQAAAAVYEPIAEAPPEQTDVPVQLTPLHLLAASAPGRLEAARARDAARWAARVERESAEDEMTYLRRLALLEAESVIDAFDDESDAPGTVPLPSPAQMAALNLPGVAADFLAELDRDPADALGLVAQLAATGEYTAREVLDDATHTAVLGACLTLSGAAREADPSLAAERALAVAGALATVVTVASIDAVAETRRLLGGRRGRA